jgi:hypothetical protein
VPFPLSFLTFFPIGEKKEFNMEASQKFSKGEYIYELDLMPIDGLENHTELSAINPTLTKDSERPWSHVCYLGQSNLSTTIASNIMLR